jgi:hypothetical protein
LNRFGATDAALGMTLPRSAALPNSRRIFSLRLLERLWGSKNMARGLFSDESFRKCAPQQYRAPPGSNNQASLRRIPIESMIRKSGNRFSEKIMLKQRDEIMMRFHLLAS